MQKMITIGVGAINLQRFPCGNWYLLKMDQFQRDGVMIIDLPVSIMTIFVVPLCRYSFVATILCAPTEVPRFRNGSRRFCPLLRCLREPGGTYLRSHGGEVRVMVSLRESSFFSCLYYSHYFGELMHTNPIQVNSGEETPVLSSVEAREVWWQKLQQT